MVYPRKVLFLTITAEGEIFSWDNKDRALLAKNDDDEYFELLLTVDQTEKFKKALRRAKHKRG